MGPVCCRRLGRIYRGYIKDEGGGIKDKIWGQTALGDGRMKAEGRRESWPCSWTWFGGRDRGRENYRARVREPGSPVRD